MKRILLVMFFSIIIQQKAGACYATFTHTYACAGDTMYFTAVDQNAVYTWDFGDTTSGVANVSHDTDTYHVYMTPGTYYVTLFVNIGYSWDYRTQIITVGSDCFNASFSYACSGPLSVNFINESTGAYTTSYWNFGDPLSGTSDTSTLKELYHSFSSPGTYSVTLITSDGTNTDTTVQTLTVDTTCLSAQFFNMLSGDCVQDFTTIHVSYSGQPVSYLWDFGDPNSAAANTSTDSIGGHQFSAAGIYLVSLVISDGSQIDTFYTVENIVDCSVWPGNINTDGEVNMEDLFALGIYYGDSGIARPSPSNSWMAQPSPKWNLSNSNYMYLQNLLDKKYADCNGDGIVNANDLTAIDLNYGKHQPNYYHNDKLQMMPVSAGDPVLKINAPTTWTGPSAVSIPIDLSGVDSVRSVYGISARIYYLPSIIVPNSMTITFTNSWLGTSGTDMITLVKDNYTDGYIDLGMVRKDHVSRTGNGTIAYLNFTVNHYTGLMDLNIDPEVKLISNGMGHNEVFLPVSSRNTQMSVNLISVKEISNDDLTIFPNPASSILNISMKDEIMVGHYQLMDATGKIIKEEILASGKNKLKLNCEDVANGIYFLRLETSAGKINVSVEVKR